MGLNHDERTLKPKSLMLCGKELPWVERAEHLGHVFTSNGKMDQDIEERLAQYIDSTTKIRENFKFAHPWDQILAMEKHCTF